MARQPNHQGRPGISNSASLAVLDHDLQCATMRSPRIAFFISREDSMVPLIPADELPVEINLRGVPRVLNVHQTVGMRHVDFVQSSGHEFELEEDPTPQDSTRDHSMESSSTQTSPSDIGDQAQRPDTRPAQPQTTKILSAEQAIRRNNNTTSALRSATGLLQSKHAAPITPHTVAERSKKSPSGTTHVVREGGKAEQKRPLQSPTERTSTLSKKEYCTHWLRHGECDYVQQGCKYKHEMPDLKKLQQIGFRAIPHWYVQQYGESQSSKPRLARNNGSYRRGSWRSRQSFHGRPARNGPSDTDAELTDRFVANLQPPPKNKSPAGGASSASQTTVHAGPSQMTRSPSSIEREKAHERMVDDLISFDPSPPRHESTTPVNVSTFAAPTGPAQMRNNHLLLSPAKHTHRLDYGEDSPRLRRRENPTTCVRSPSAR